MVEGDDPGRPFVDQHDVVGADGTNEAAVELAVGDRHDTHGLSVLRLQQVVAQRPPAAGGRLGGMLLGGEGLVEPVPQTPRQIGEVGMLQRVCQDFLRLDTADVSGRGGRLKGFDVT